MLIEFKITNFGSIKETQAFSLVASKNKELMDSHTFDVQLAEQSSMKLLRSAAIYGPNAAGKTNLVRAFRVMKKIVLTSALGKSRGDTFPVVPFKLHHESRQAPSAFEVLFLVDGVCYQYGFSATKKRVVQEWLSAFPKRRAQRWFKRTWNVNKQKYDWVFGAFLAGEKTLWQQSTRDNALFLSTAVQLNSQQLQPVHDWFKNALCFVGTRGLTPAFSTFACTEEGYKRKILNFLKEADLGIDDVNTEEEIFNPHKSPKGLPDTISQNLIKGMESKKLYTATTVHQSSEGESIEFDMGAESDGTRKIFALAGPFLYILKKGHVVFIDELHAHLHPKLVKFLVGLFNNRETNPGNAQLVFTTHETHVLNQKILRRDQIWFCEKDRTLATQIFPLTDFRPRKMRENLESAYLSGRYGALPYVPELQA